MAPLPSSSAPSEVLTPASERPTSDPAATAAGRRGAAAVAGAEGAAGVGDTSAPLRARHRNTAESRRAVKGFHGPAAGSCRGARRSPGATFDTCTRRDIVSDFEGPPLFVGAGVFHAHTHLRVKQGRGPRSNDAGSRDVSAGSRLLSAGVLGPRRGRASQSRRAHKRWRQGDAVQARPRCELGVGLHTQEGSGREESHGRPEPVRGHAVYESCGGEEPRDDARQVPDKGCIGNDDLQCRAQWAHATEGLCARQHT